MARIPQKEALAPASNHDQRLLALYHRVQMLSALSNRVNFFSQLGYEYGGDRDLYRALGYKTTLEFADYAAQYERQDLAKAVIDRPVDITWRGGFEIWESDDDENTPLEKEAANLIRRLRLRSMFSRLDRLVGLGKYGLLLLGLSDGPAATWRNPVTGTGHRLNFVKPFSEGAVTVQQYETDSTNPRYGLPTIYQIEYANLERQGQITLQVHHTRVIHVADGILESDFEGTPRLKAVFNRLKDVEKIVGGSAEMFWRGARPGYQGKLDSGSKISDDDLSALEAQVDEYEHNQRRMLITEGLELKALAMQVADPKGHIDAQIQMISAETDIPKRILTGSERGELASSQDQEGWIAFGEGRREDFAEPAVVRATFDRFIELGILPPPADEEKGYEVRWKDLRTISDKERADVFQVVSAALKNFAGTTSPDQIVPWRTFLSIFFSKEELDLAEEELKAEMELEAQAEEELAAEAERQAQEEAARQAAAGGGRQPPEEQPPGQE